MKTKSVSVIISAIAGLMSSLAFAHPPAVPNVPGQWDHVHVNGEYTGGTEPGVAQPYGTWLPTSGSATFVGTDVTLVCGSVINLNCTFTVEGQVRLNASNEMEIRVLNASSSNTVSSNDSTCGTVNFANFPWDSTPVPGSDSPTALTDDVQGTINNVEVRYPIFGTIAAGSIEVTYNNGPAPTFDLTGSLPSWLFGSCSVGGVVTTASDILAY